MKKLHSLALTLACLALAGCSGAPAVSPVVPTGAPAPTAEPTGGLTAATSQSAPVQELKSLPAPAAAPEPATQPAPAPTPATPPASSPAPAPEAPPAAQADAHEPAPIAQQITMADNNRTFQMSVNQTFALVLGGPEPTWAVTIDNPAVLSRVVNIMPIRGSQGVFRAHTPGTAHLQAVGTFSCQQAKPVSCKIASPLFQVTIVVQ